MHVYLINCLLNYVNIDYVYTSKDRVIGFKIGDADKWIELSDHMPITFEIKE